jgi:hypothetical protein
MKFTFNRMGTGCFQGEMIGLGFKVEMVFKVFCLFGPWNYLLNLGSLSYSMREISYVNYLLLPM